MINPNWSLQSARLLFENVTISHCVSTLMNYSSSMSTPKDQAPHITPTTQKHTHKHAKSQQHTH